MGLYKRNETWWVSFTTPDGSRVRRSTGTADKVAAQEYHDTLKAEHWRVRKMGDKPKRTWEEAAVRWIKERRGKKDLDKDKDKLRWVDSYLRGRQLDEIDADMVESIAAAKESEGCGPATVNRLLALIRAILRRAWKKWEWIDRVPAIEMREEPQGRTRFLTREEVDVLIEALPEHLADMVIFSTQTGLRASNVTRLKWSTVDLEKRLVWVEAKDSKTGKAIGVPLNSVALGVLERNKGRHLTYVFTYEGEPIRSNPSNHGWYNALQKAGIEDLRWHDLRHTWASWHAQAGTPMSVIKRLGGWKTYAMVERYAHLSAGHMAPHAEKIAEVFGTNVSHRKKEDDVST